MKYITKQDALNKGLIKKDGKIYKLSVLEIWFKKGYLDLDKSKYSADERLEYGLRLVFDYPPICICKRGAALFAASRSMFIVSAVGGAIPSSR